MNKKEKYYFNHNTLSYVKVVHSPIRKIINFLILSLSIVFTSGILSVLFFSVADSPREKHLERELSNLKINYEILNRKVDQSYSILSDLEDRDNNIYRVIFEMDSIPQSTRKSGFGGINRYNKLKGYNNTALISKITQKVDVLSKQIFIQSKSYDDIVSLIKNKNKMLASLPAIQPVRNKNLKRMSSGYGIRIDPVYKTRKMHYGMDFSAPKGTPVYATGDGVVQRTQRAFSKSSRKGYGNCVLINHGYNHKTFYAHMQNYIVRKGQRVKRGDIIGYVGNSGKSTAPHLHYEVHKNGKKVNPVHYYYDDLTAEQYDEMLRMSETTNQSLD